MTRGGPVGPSPRPPASTDLALLLERGLHRADPRADHWAATGGHEPTIELPDGVDHDQLVRAQRTAMRLRHGFLLALKGASLMFDFWSPSMARSLLSTGRMLDEPRRRMEATARWWTRVHLPGSFRVRAVDRGDADGIRATLEVRRAHAIVRQQLPGDDGGVPISQTQLLVQVMGFTVVPIAALELMGHRVTVTERESIYALWRVVGHVLGVDAELLPLINERDLGAVRDWWVATHEPDEDGRRLAAAVSATPPLTPRWLRGQERPFRWYEQEMTRAFVGPVMADALGLPGSGDGRRARSLTRPIVCTSELARRIDPTADDRRVRRAVLRSHRLLDGGRPGPQTLRSTHEHPGLGTAEVEVLA